MFRRRPPAEPAGQARGPGGGRVRQKPARKERGRRRLGLADYLFLGVIATVAVIALEHYLVKTSWTWSIIAGVVVGVLSVLYQWFTERRRWRPAPGKPAPPRSRKR